MRGRVASGWSQQPFVVAVHVRDRDALPKVAAYLDHLILLGALRGWEPSDPGGADRPGATSDPIEFLHPPADVWTNAEDTASSRAASQPIT